MTTSGTGPLWQVLGRLGDSPKKSGKGYEARCPAHEDRHRSLSIGVGDDGRVLLDCHTGCPTERVLQALNLGWEDLFEKSQAGNPVRRFRLLNMAGHVVAEHVREDLPTHDKKIWWESNGKRGLNGTAVVDLPLYRAASVADTPPTVPVVLCEGEKAAQALVDIGICAVATVTGADQTPSDSVLAVLQGREVWLWPDNDAPGREHMARIARKIRPSPKWIDWKDAPEKGDAADYVAAGGTAVGLQTMLVVLEVRPGGPRLAVVRMSDVRPEPIGWLWKGRLARGKATLKMGDPGLGKSLTTHWTAATVSVGGPWPDGGRCELGAAILFTIEDGLADTVAPRLIAAGADMNRVIAVRGVIDDDANFEERMFALTSDVEMLRDLIRQEHAIYVVMDPVTAYLGPDVNSHKEAEVRAVLGPLQMMAEDTGVALELLMHMNKGTGVSALYRAVGSIAFPAVARVVLGVAPDPNDEDGKRKLLLPVKMNIGQMPEGIGYRIERTQQNVLARATEEEQPPIVVWDNDPVLVDATSALDRAGAVQELGALEECKRALTQIMANGPVAARDGDRQLKDSGSLPSPATLIRARRELGIRVKKEGFGGQWFWYPAEDYARARELKGMDGMDSMESSRFQRIQTLPKNSMITARAHARMEPVCPIHHVGFDDHDCSAL